MDHSLYYAAIAADHAFEVALIRVYGPAKACDARYRYDHSDPALVAAKAAKFAADEAWHKAQVEARA